MHLKRRVTPMLSNNRGLRTTGFTLLEVLVAVAIFALIGIAAISALVSAQSTQAHLKSRGERFHELTRAINDISRDYRQLATRRVRDQNGELLPVVRGHDDGHEVFFEFTRSGWRNPAQLPRSTLEHVIYRLEDDKLLRYSYPFLDQAPQNLAEKQVLLDGVKHFQIKFMPLDTNNAGNINDWRREWPVGGSLNTTDAQLQPRAVEISLELDGIGEVHRVLP